MLAREAVSLDHASGGRYELGIGWGSVPSEFDVFGAGSTVPRERVDRLRETTPADISACDVAELYPALLRRAVADDPTQMLAMVELYLEAVRRPGVRAALSGMVLANAEAGAALQQAAGLPSTVRDTGLLDAYFLGVAISLLALPVETLETVGLDDPYALGIGVFSATVPNADPSPERRSAESG